HSSSKKLVLSLVTISFLASCANATLNSEIKTYDEVNKNLKARSASVYSSQNGTSTIINSLQSNNAHTISGTNNTLTITNSGTISFSGQPSSIAVTFTQGSSTSTFLNQGTLQGGVNAASVQVGDSSSGGATINTFNNEGIIGNNVSTYGIKVYGSSDNKSTIESFINSGTINSKTNESIYFGNTDIQTFNNQGTISSTSGNAINLASGATIDNFTNTGSIVGYTNSNKAGVNLTSGSSIKTFTNESGGFISANKGMLL
ncbi:hypothetical protein KJK76_001896, partial [Campylobacter jejuni]|nr:hypothetical protein [Campylobacter jejuni]